jgi:transposase-like protein
VSKVSVLSGPERRRCWTPAEKRRIVEESLAPCASVIEVARQHDVHPNLLTVWRRQARTGSSAGELASDLDGMRILLAAADGFEKAVALRPPVWTKLLDADVDTAAAMSGMLLLADIARGEKEVDDCDALMAAAPDKIADWVVILNEWRLANTEPVQGSDPRVVTSPRKKVGRNEPCPCGSGKKYKKCCGLN